MQYLDMSDIYYKWANRVVEGVTEVYPNKWFTISAYREVMEPPSFPLHPQIIPRIAKDRMTWIDDKMRHQGHQQMDDLMQVARQIAWYEYMYGFFYHVPRPYPHLIAENLRYAKENGVIGLFIETQANAGEGPKA